MQVKYRVMGIVAALCAVGALARQDEIRRRRMARFPSGTA